MTSAKRKIASRNFPASVRAIGGSFVKALPHMKRNLALIFLAFAFAASVPAAEPSKPLKILLITGGCCHDYKVQKDILKKGLEARANIVVEQMHTDDKTTKPPLPLYGNPDYAKGYDLVLHDECASDIKEPATVEGVLKPHREGVPGVNLHCAMHCYRVSPDFGKNTVQPGSPGAIWFDYLGLQSSRHDWQKPIAIRYTDKDSPITKGLEDWITINEEHYNNVQVFPTAKAIAYGKQAVKEGENDFVVAWTNTYVGKTRVFSTTIGHNNATVEDPRYLELVTRGVLWACDKLDPNGNPKPGYGPGGR
jgi:Trehalose utilisation